MSGTRRWPVRLPAVAGGTDGRRMLAVALVDRVGSGLSAAVIVLYFTFVAHLGVAQIGLITTVAGIAGIAGAPIGGRLADRFAIPRLLAVVQSVRAVAALGLLASGHFALLVVCTAVGGFGDRAANVLTKVYATRVAGPARGHYQAVYRTASNAGWAVGGLAAALALTAGTTEVYRALLIGDALSFAVITVLTLRCADIPAPSEPETPAEAPAGDRGGVPAGVRSPWRDRAYLAFVATDTVLFFDDAVFKVGLPLWAVHSTPAPHALVPLLLVVNNLLVVGLQVPLSRYGATTASSRALLLPLSALFAVGGVTMAAARAGGPVSASVFLVAAAVAFTLAEIVHATISWELSVALAPGDRQGAYLGVHGLAQANQRAAGPLAVTAAIAAGPVGWCLFGFAVAGSCFAQHRVVAGRTAALAAEI